MVNRSKKSVLSARVDPYLKTGLELLAESRGVKIVKLLESMIDDGLSNAAIVSPLRKEGRVPFLTTLKAVWSEDDVLLRLRVGWLDQPLAGERTWRMGLVVSGEECFRGDFDVFGDLNGMSDTYNLKAPNTPKIDLERVQEEWHLIGEYVDFIENNKPLEPTYDQYKRMRDKSDSKS